MVERSKNCSEPEVLAQQEKHSGKPYTSLSLQSLENVLQKPVKLFSLLTACVQHGNWTWIKKIKRKCSKEKEQMKYIHLCNSTMPFSYYPCILYRSSVTYLWRISPSELCKLPIGRTLLSSLAISFPYGASALNWGTAVGFLKVDEMNENFCIYESWKVDNVTFIEYWNTSK